MNPARGTDTEALVRKEASSPNRLIHEQSPYLLQHARNPVDWFPWSEEAFSKAREENKPIFLSIGYSSCHWCHVMEKESFADPQVATLMNEVFVCIKVDREERPDLDQIYMTAAHLLTGRGGWPLTILMTPDKKPFFAASYIPKESQYGMTGMLDLIPRIHKVWETQREELEHAGNQVLETLKRAAQAAPGKEDLKERILYEAYDALKQSFDREHGGFGDAPKFLTPHNLIFLLRFGNRAGNESAYRMVETTLRAMRRGGVFDHIGFGFHRYSTDAEWFVPHFEKMLYDQALMVLAYTEAYLATGRSEYEEGAREVVAYILREMTDPNGGFYSAEDADSEGEEGKFYLWTKDEILQALGYEDGERFARIFDVQDSGNYREAPTGERTGRNILRLRRPLSAWAQEFSVSEGDLKGSVESSQQKLYAVRRSRTPPSKDDKILTDWNALMIAALAKAARTFDDRTYLDAAEKAASFVLTHLRRPDGRLLHRYRNGEAGLPATLDDYAFMLWALIELYETSFAVGYLRSAIEFSRDLIIYFWDCDQGGFFFTANDEDVPVRQKLVYDGALPSGNSVAMYALFMLGRMTANLEFEEMARRIQRVFAESVRSAPAVHTFLLTALDVMLGPTYEVIIAGIPGAEDTARMVRALWSHYIPDTVVLFRPADEDVPEIAKIARFMQDIVTIEDAATAYVCTNYACDIPTTEIDEMLSLLKTTKSPEPVV
jgi:uncharacterized protein YyaL (SSP411 family)